MTDKDNGNGNGRRRGWWLAFTLDTDRDRVRRIFEARHGYPPAELIESGPILLAGPLQGSLTETSSRLNGNLQADTQAEA